MPSSPVSSIPYIPYIPYILLGAPAAGIEYKDRISVRCIVFDTTTRKIGLIRVANGNYYKLPGGGIEGQESPVEALQRELLEEIGCTISLSSMTLIGRSEEFRLENQHQISLCYAAVLVENTGEVQLTEEEAQDGFETVWLGVEDAVGAIRAVVEIEVGSERDEFRRFVTARDKFFVGVYAERFGKEGWRSDT